MYRSLNMHLQIQYAQAGRRDHVTIAATPTCGIQPASNKTLFTYTQLDALHVHMSVNCRVLLSPAMRLEIFWCPVEEKLAMVRIAQHAVLFRCAVECTHTCKYSLQVHEKEGI